MENWQIVCENNFFNRFHKSLECEYLIKDFAEVLKPLFEHSMKNLPTNNKGEKYGDAAAGCEDCKLLGRYKRAISYWEGSGTHIDDVPDENVFLHFNAEFLQMVKRYVSWDLLNNEYDVLIKAKPEAGRNSCEIVVGLRVGCSDVW